MSPSPHLDVQLAERYVLDLLTPPEAAALEAHVEGCAGCAALLAREARLELALEAVAARAEPVPRPRAPGRAWRVARSVALPALASCALLIAVALTPPAPRASPALPAPEPIWVACPELDATACAARARFDGLMVMYPAGEVPRYEELGAVVTP